MQDHTCFHYAEMMGKHAEELDARIGVSSRVLAATWGAGLFVVSSGTPQQELANHSVRALAPDGYGGALAIVDGRSLCRRAPDGVWSTIATAEMNLACCVAVGDVIYVGTDEASVLRVSPAGEIEQLRGFEGVAGRDQWYAGTALIDGKLVGPPLGIRSITATSDGTVLLANVHVGGIPRSADSGATWQPTIDIESDVHEVCAHPNRPGIVAAAAAIGLCTSSDGGVTWEVEQRGLHALHCSAVAFTGNEILVSAATDPFAPQGAIYRRGVDERGPLVPVTGGLPAWLDGKADTGCLAADGSAVAVADANGNLHVSADYGRTWACRAQGLPTPSSILIV
ncbi:MAG TPA: hypothetical protein VJ302_12065 [Blastocatellia bacterium]|nr:hypothetical protein [Blastocatellia bacterium]